MCPAHDARECDNFHVAERADFDGTEVPEEESSLAWIAAHAVDSAALPSDLADRHDFYLYGRSRGDEVR